MQREFIATLDWIQAALTDKDKTRHLQKWQRELASPSPLLHTFSFLPGLSTITSLPSLSFLLHIPFRLQKPYLSKDERDFYLLDNPLRREKVFQTPMIASTSWKGALRAAMVQQLAQWWNSLEPSEKGKRNHRKRFVSRRITIARLFGTEKSAQVDDQQFESYFDKLGGEYQARWYRRYVRRYMAANGFFAGRLYFFPTFFDNIGLEVINPHDRKTGVGARGPILMECVPQGTTGELVLLYVPFGPIGQSEDEKRAQVAQDLEVVAKGIQAMLTTYGFGAKTSSGYGVAEEKLVSKGKLLLRAELPGETAQASAEPRPRPEPALPRYLESPTRLHPDLRRPDGSLKSEEEYRAFIESRGRKYSKKCKQLYDKAKAWWEREGQALMEAASQKPEPEPEPVPPKTPPIAEYTSRTLNENELHQVAKQVAEALRKEVRHDHQ